VDPRAGVNAVAKRNIPTLCRGSNPDRPARSLVAIPTELSQLLIITEFIWNCYGSEIEEVTTNWPFGSNEGNKKCLRALGESMFVIGHFEVVKGDDRIM
jgi:hypothetical protein